LSPVLIARARKLGIRLLVGTDTGKYEFTRHGELHATAIAMFIKYGGCIPMVVAATRA
jgi:hypothetical protein